MGRLVRLNTILRVGFDIGALATPHAPEYVGEPMGVAGAPTSNIRCAAMLELAGNQDRGTVHQPPPAGDSPFGDPNTACTERASGVDAGNSHLMPTGRPKPYMRRCYSLIEENYVLQEGRQAAVEKNLVDFGSRPTRNMPQCDQPVSRVASCRGSSACSTPRGGSFDEIWPVRSNGA